jgi:very-short-patch-repair endonuclease
MILTFIKGIEISKRIIENLPYNPQLAKLAKKKRKVGILSEVLFWNQVKNKQFYNLDFDRQRIIGNYIVDFYIKTLGLVIEIDGESHAHFAENDLTRNNFLESYGLKVYRIEDYEIKQNLFTVLQDLEDFIILEYGVKE